MVVLGIDPGLERIGYGIVRREGSRLTCLGLGLIQTPRIATVDRLSQIFDEVTDLVRSYRPDAVATERLFYAKNQTTVIEVAKAIGVVHLALARAGLHPAELSPPEVKLAVVGNGRAEKRQVQFMVQRLLGLVEAPKPDDVADGLALAIALALRGGAQA
ncbi:MAG: crossover junction endodeoxyribonuclease RuvC [Armatimonadetes bacterium]|nr:crossover junction endodeoxyribonuclease RuvC [Armatimonadota bacterium]